MSEIRIRDRRILVVDDEERMVRFIRLNLEHDGFQVVEAFRGTQALDKLRSGLPDVVLLDVMMPDIDGFEVLRMIREVSNVPVIMLTAKGEEEDRIKGLELGADDYITKPFSPRELVSRVRAVLRRTEAAAPAAHEAIEVDKRVKLGFDRGGAWGRLPLHRFPPPPGSPCPRIAFARLRDLAFDSRPTVESTRWCRWILRFRRAAVG